MGEYGPGLTSGQAFMKDKERIKKALEGFLVCGEDDDGFVYAPAEKEECEKFILQTFDNAVFLCQDALAHGRALERLLKEHTNLNTVDYIKEYAEIKVEEISKYQDYKYESSDEFEQFLNENFDKKN